MEDSRALHSPSGSLPVAKRPGASPRFGLQPLRLQQSAVLLVALLFVALFAFAILRPIQVLPRISVGPGFALTDQSGQRLTSEDLRGQFVLYNFTYTSCQTPCPETGAVMRQIQQQLQEMDTGGIPVQLVTISFDPERDTPDRLMAYAQQHNAALENWRFVTGAPALLKQVIGGGFGVYYEPRADANQLLASDAFKFEPTFVLTDGWGILRAEYRTATPDLAIIGRDLRLLAQEAHNSQGVTRYAYEAAHLFLCYPR